MNFSIKAISFLVTFCMLVLPGTSSDLDGHVEERSLRSKTPRQKSTFSIKLTPDNEIAPFVGVDNAFGLAEVEIKKTRACIDGKIYGFFPMAAHIHFGAINENGDVIVDFTSLIRMGNTKIEGCVKISEEVSRRILGRPDLYYVNIHVGTEEPLILSAIRGQFISSFFATVDVRQTVAPFDQLTDRAYGDALLSFESAGSIACYDTVIDGFDPGFAHIHMAPVGMNGPRVLNFTSTKVGPGRFTGCQDVTSSDVEGDIETVKALLANYTMYYFDYHLGLTSPEVNQSVRGQIMAC